MNLEERIVNKISAIAAIADELPVVVIIHDLQTSCVKYLSPRGCSYLGVTLDEIIALGVDYHKVFFNEEDAADYVPKILGLLERNNTDEVISFFQQVRKKGSQCFQWYMSTIKIFMRNEEGLPVLTITTSSPIDPEHHFATKVERLLDDNNFLRNNGQQFSRLSKREQAVLACMAKGMNSASIGQELNISVETVKTHRRNIKRKLGVKTHTDITQYARAFDLI